MKDDVDFPKLVKQIRGARGLTQEAFARELDVSFSTVNTWENGKHAPMRHLARKLLELADELGIKPVKTTRKASTGRPKGRRA